MARGSVVLAVLVLAAWVSVASPARADLPPPSDKKFVSYGFVVDNLEAFPEYVLLAYPFSASHGVPTKEHALIEHGKTLQLGRRSPAPKLYAMKRASYEKWKASYQPVREGDDPALEALFSGKEVLACGIALTPKTLIDKHDPRDAVVDELRVEGIDAGACRVALTKTRGASTPPAPTAPAPAPTTSSAPAPPVAPPASATPAAPSAPSTAGCGSCEVRPAAEHDAAAWAVLVLGALCARRRSRAP